MIRLTDKENPYSKVQMTYGEQQLAIVFDKGAKAQLKKVVEWGGEPCPHTHNPNYFKPRRNCDKCWQALLEEVKG